MQSRQTDGQGETKVALKWNENFNYPFITE